MDWRALSREIKESFTDVGRPSMDMIVVDTFDDEGASELFHGESWNECVPANLERYPTAVWFLTNEAFAYYLPCYLLVLCRSGTRRTTIWGHVIEQFRRPIRQPVVRELLSGKQRAVTAKVFKALADDEGEDLNEDEEQVISELEASP